MNQELENAKRQVLNLYADIMEMYNQAAESKFGRDFLIQSSQSFEEYGKSVTKFRDKVKNCSHEQLDRYLIGLLEMLLEVRYIEAPIQAYETAHKIRSG